MIDSSDDSLDTDRLCFGCFIESAIPGPCPRCGYDREKWAREFPTALSPGSVLAGKYLAGRVLGKPGGFGIAYLGYELNLQAHVAIKEYMPRELVTRDSGDGATVVPHSGEDGDLFRYGLDGFLEEARTLAKLDHRNIVEVRDYFEENKTAYLVMKFYEGESLGERLSARGGLLPAEELLPVITPILDALKYVHTKGLLHRDIKPANIYVTEDGRPILLDFGAARQAMGERSRSLSSVLSPGYAPFEQYHRRGNQGPWTDIYAIAATLYRALTGTAPPEANERLAGEPLPTPRSIHGQIPVELEAAILWGLKLDVQARPQDVAAFESALAGEARPSLDGVETHPVEGADGSGSPRDRPPGSVPHGELPTEPLARAGGVLPPPGAEAEAGKKRRGRGVSGRLVGGVIAVGALVGLVMLLNWYNFALDPRDRLVEALTDLTLPQASFLTANGAYAEDVDKLGLSPDPDMSIEIREATLLGWSAVASLTGYDEVCSVFVGDATPPPHAARPGIVGCGTDAGDSPDLPAVGPDIDAAPDTPGESDTLPRAVLPIPEVETPEVALEGEVIPEVALAGGFVPDPHVLSLTAGGSVSASAIGSAECAGYVDRPADLLLAYSNPASYLSIFADADSDLTLMVRSPGGVFSCNDDSPLGGLDPLVEFNSPAAGRYEIWIGIYGEGARAEARLEISEVETPAAILAGGFLPDPHVLNLTAGGSVSASAIGPAECVGYVDRLPDALLAYSSPASYLSIFADSDTDLTLMVRSPGGVFSCNDDSPLGGLDPLVEFNSPTAGRYEIWIGTLGEGGRPAARLDISELRPPAESSGSETPTAILAGGFLPDPHVLNLSAGGSVSASAIGPAECLGYVDRLPDALLAYSNPASYLSIFADADTDLTLMVRSPSGVFSCNDDSPLGGLDPLVEFNSPAAGRYEIWIGTLSEGGRPAARLDISELRGTDLSDQLPNTIQASARSRYCSTVVGEPTLAATSARERYAKA